MREPGLSWRQKLIAQAFSSSSCAACDSKCIDGLWVGTFQNAPEVLPKVERALQLIKLHDRRRYDRLLRDLERVLVGVLSGSIGRFDRRLSACELEIRFVLDEASSPAIASPPTIVHEATHARLWRCGIRYDEKRRHRVEVLCFRRELAFAARLPNPEQVREIGGKLPEGLCRA